MARRGKKLTKHDVPRVPEGEEKLKPGRRVYTVAEARAQLEAVHAMMLQNLGEGQVVARMRRPSEDGSRPACGANRTVILMRKVREAWKRDTETTLADRKAAAIKRAHRFRNKAEGLPLLDKSGKQVGWITPPNHQALLGWERHLANIEGTNAPLQVNVDVRVSQAVSQVFMNLNGEQAAKFLAQAREDRALADRARALEAGASMVVHQPHPGLNGKNGSHA